jgi:hypothetical protein
MQFKLRYTKDDENGNPQPHLSEVVNTYGSIEAKQWLLDKESEAYNIKAMVV